MTLVVYYWVCAGAHMDPYHICFKIHGRSYDTEKKKIVCVCVLGGGAGDGRGGRPRPDLRTLCTSVVRILRCR